LEAEVSTEVMMDFLNYLRKDAAIEKIIRFIHSNETAPVWSSWYAGITDAPARRLYGEHKALISMSIFVSVDLSATAREVEKYLIERYGIAGNPGGNGDNPRYVYVFKKTLGTDPPL
jgi:hypothetical protein